MHDYIVKKTITINAKPSAVWDALTNPEKTREYFFHCRVISQWKEGSPITFKGKFLWIFPIEMKGRIVKLVPEKLLQYVLHNKGGSMSIVTDELTYANGKTHLSISDNVGKEEGAEKRYERSVKGWTKILTGLKQLVEESNHKA